MKIFICMTMFGSPLVFNQPTIAQEQVQEKTTSQDSEQTHYILTLDIKENLAEGIARDYLKEFSNENPGISLATYIINEKPVLTLIMDNTFSAEDMNDGLRDFLKEKGLSNFEIESYEIINNKPYKYIGWNYNFPSSTPAKPIIVAKSPLNQNLQNNNTDTQDDILVNFNKQYWAITVGAPYAKEEEALHHLESFNALAPQMGNATFKVVTLEDGFSIVYGSNQYFSKNQAKLEIKDVKNLVGNVYPQMPENFLKRNHTKPDKDPDCACNLLLDTALIAR